MKIECPKCGMKTAWIEQNRMDTTLRCMCGYLKVLATRIQQIVITHSDVKEEIKLPKKLSKLWDTVKVLQVMEPANSARITDRMVDLGIPVTVNDVSSYLTILRSKGLVEVTQYRRGLLGGSTWKLSDDCVDLLGEEK